MIVNGTGLNFNINAASKTHHKDTPKPFVLKLKTKNIRICQSCRKDYDGSNDTLGLVVPCYLFGGASRSTWLLNELNGT